MEVSVSLLGGFAASVDGVEVPESVWRLKKARELVKLLALASGNRLHREVAMDVLWPQLGASAAANNLNQAVHVARRALGADAIGLRDEVLTLAARVDVEILERAAADARCLGTATAYSAALALYRGELLPENRYDDWAAERREALAELAAELADNASRLGGSSRFVLPAEASSFVGRGRELTELETLLARTRLLTLCGTGGVGKTRLALELARAAEPGYDAGAVFVDLASVSESSLVTEAVAAALDVRPLPAQELVDALTDFLAPRTLLLVLDNCEHVLTASATLADVVLRAAPCVTIVATSREPLRNGGEIVFRVPSLAIPDPERHLEPHRLADYESVSLFVARAEAAAPGFALDASNAEDVARICLRLDGLPLALELAAARLGALSPAAVSERLDDRFRLLRSGSHAAPTRQQTLTATLEWSHDLLEADERMLFRRLAVFSGGFELEAVEEVCASADLPAAEIADVLGRLVEKSLVSVDRGERGHRYRLLETVRLYARSRLEEARELPALAERHAQWALALARRGTDSRRLERERANLRTAFDTLLANEPTDALRLCVALTTFWLIRIELEEGKRRFAEALAAAPERTLLRADALLAAATMDFRSGTLARGTPLADESLAIAHELGDRQAEWRALQFLGELGVASDEADVAVPWFEQALALAREEGFAAAEALGVHSLGVTAWMAADFARADELLSESVERFRAAEASGDTISSPLSLAETWVRGRGLDLVFQDTLQPFHHVSCAVAAGYALVNLASIAHARQELTRAHQLLDESAEVFATNGDDAALATVRVRRAYVLLDDGDTAGAREELEAALELRGRLHDRRGRGLVLSGLGLVETAAGAYDAADRFVSEARELFRRAGDRWGLASTLWRAADLALARGDVDGAESALDEAYAVLGETGRERWIANTETGLAEIACRRADVERARALLADARTRFAARDDIRGLARVDERVAQLQSSR
ncbi:MAG TPA: AAA family ATPase [Gaiellaceae bacterium]